MTVKDVLTNEQMDSKLRNQKADVEKAIQDQSEKVTTKVGDVLRELSTVQKSALTKDVLIAEVAKVLENSDRSCVL